MKKKLSERKIPSFFAFVLLLASIWITSLLIQRGVSIIGRAAPDTTPQDVRITNATDTSFSVFFETRDKTSAAVKLDGENGALVVYDDRDKKTGNPQAYYSHGITIPNLNPITHYAFSLLVNGKEVLQDGRKFVFSTGPKIETPPPTQTSIRGKVSLPDGTAGNDTLLFVSIPHAQPLSVITGQEGKYSIPLNSLRDDSLGSYAKLEETETIKIEAKRQDLSSTIQILYKDAASIPLITLAKNYDFQSIQEGELATPSSSLTIPLTNIARPGQIQILTPRRGQNFVDLRPLFQGNAIPGKKVKITINSPQIIQAEVVADRNGVWSFRPDVVLAPGAHTIMIETEDAAGAIIRLIQTFNVFSLGTQVAESATPSATPTQAPVVTATPTPSVGITTTITPLPTAIVLSPLPTQPPATPFPTKPLPSPGSTTPLVLTFVSILFILAGTTLLFIIG